MRNRFTALVRLSFGGLGAALVGGLAGIGSALLLFVTCAVATGYDAREDVIGFGAMAEMACVFVGAVAGGFTGVLLVARRRRATEAQTAPRAPQPPSPPA